MKELHFAGIDSALRNANCSEHGNARISRNVEVICARARAHCTCPLRKVTKWPRIRTVSPCCPYDDDSTHAWYRYANATQISHARSCIRDVALSRERLGSDSGAIFPLRPCLEFLYV